MDEEPDKHPALGTTPEAAEQLAVVAQFVLAHEDLQALSLISHSWGSMPAGRFAGTHPALLDRWVLFGPIAQRDARRYETPPQFPAWKLVSAEDQWARFVEDVPAHEAPVLCKSEFDDWARAYLSTDPASRLRNPPSVKTPLGPFSEIIAAWHGVFPYDPALVQAPVAIVRGEWDGLVPDDDARRLFDAFSRSPEKRGIKISRGTHLMHLETMRRALWRESINFLLGDAASPLLQRNGR